MKKAILKNGKEVPLQDVEAEVLSDMMVNKPSNPITVFKYKASGSNVWHSKTIDVREIAAIF